MNLFAPAKLCHCRYFGTVSAAVVVLVPVDGHIGEIPAVTNTTTGLGPRYLPKMLEQDFVESSLATEFLEYVGYVIGGPVVLGVQCNSV